MDFKVCGTCNRNKPIDQFSRNGGGRLRSSCKTCQRPFANARLYKLSIDEYETLYAAGKCGICGTTEAGGRGRFHIDHCHASGKVRGILCLRCNTGLGSLGDNIESLKLAISYLVNA
jgi:hypothetical protein